MIPLTELAVRWDTAAGRFALLWTPPRGEDIETVEVVPLITSGVSPEGFVSFLVEIGRQGLQPLAWFPGFEVPGISRWPRFRSGHLVLFRRRWVFAPGEAPEPPREGTDPEAAGAQFFARAQAWRRAHALPRHVFLHTPAQEGAAPPTLHVTEMLPGPEEMWIADGQGRYASELLLHLSG